MIPPHAMDFATASSSRSRGPTFASRPPQPKDTPASVLAKAWQETQASGSSTPAGMPNAASGSGGDYFAQQLGACTEAGRGAGTGSGASSNGAMMTPKVETASKPAAADGQSNPWANLFANGGPQTSRKGVDDAVPATPGAASVRSLPQGFAFPTLSNASPRASPFSGPCAAGTEMGRSGSDGGPTLKLPTMGFRRGSGTTASSGASTSSLPQQDLSRFKAMQPGELASLLSGASEGETLVVDIRPSTSFNTARVRGSVNVCAPSTLLRRPGVTVQRIEEELLHSEKDVRDFARWRRGPMRKAPASAGRPASADSAGSPGASAVEVTPKQDGGVEHIVVLDTDTAGVGEAGKPAAGGGGACLLGILRKFDAAGFAGELSWLVGGFSHFAAACSGGASGKPKGDVDALIDRRDGAQMQREDSGDGTASPAKMEGVQATSAKLSPGAMRASPPSLVLPSNDDDAASSAKRGSLVRPGGLPMEAFWVTSTVAGRPSSNDGIKGAASDTSSNAGATVLKSQTGLKQSPAAACANPFFDNIRQNRELQHGITERIPLELPPMSSAQVAALPQFLRRLVEKSPEDQATTLAQDFFDVERAEQERLISTMQQHAAESSIDPRSAEALLNMSTVKADCDAAAQLKADRESGPGPAQLSSRFASVDADSGYRTPRDCQACSFPFSISAALERGAENRYNNIWTFEHSRVRIRTPQASSNQSDYINGSFIEPVREFRGRRRYIATQAPLPSTFEAFWTMIWEQDCRVIAMLTREYESGRVQAHNYWSTPDIGKRFKLTLESEEALDAEGKPAVVSAAEAAKAGSEAGFFGSSDAAGKEAPFSEGAPVTIRRIMTLTRKSDGTGPDASRKIVHLQYVAWPDYHIPDNPSSLLNYMDLAAAAQNEASLELQATLSPGTSYKGPPGGLVGPMVVHCSAGVGRTGTYVVIDSVLDVLRRYRRRLRGQSEPAVWDNGTQMTARGRAPRQFNLSLPGSGSRHSESRSDSFSSSSGSLPVLGEPRKIKKSLKRELSPSAMDVDQAEPPHEGVGGFVANADAYRDVSSPPPLRRNRSDDTSEADGAQTPARSSISGSSETGSTNSGLDTPSRAMGSLRIAFGGEGASAGGASAKSSSSSGGFFGSMKLPPGSPLASGVAASASSAVGNSPKPRSAQTFGGELFGTAANGHRNGSISGTSSSALGLSQPSSASPAPDAASLDQISPSLGKAVSDAASTQPSSTDGAEHLSLPDGVDLVRRAVEVTREQRMSTVQTGRQYVFTYSAVIVGLLKELRREGITSPLPKQ